MIKMKNGTKVYFKGEWTPTTRAYTYRDAKLKGRKIYASVVGDVFIVWPGAVYPSRRCLDKWDIKDGKLTDSMPQSPSPL